MTTTPLLCQNMTGSKKEHTRRAEISDESAEDTDPTFVQSNWKLGTRIVEFSLSVMDRDLERWRQAAASDGAELPELASTGAPRNAET